MVMAAVPVADRLAAMYHTWYMQRGAGLWFR